MINGAPDEQQLDASSHEEVRALLQHPSVLELLLQDLTACTAQLHWHHLACRQQRETQQQQSRTPATRSSSSSSSSSSDGGGNIWRVISGGGSNGSIQGHSMQQQQQQLFKQQLRADLLAIPAFHQHPDMLQLLPSGQAYLDVAAAAESAAAAAAAAAADRSVVSGALQDTRWRVHACGCCSVMCHSLQAGFAEHAPHMHVLSAAAIRLVLELQLLAAAEHQRCQQRLLQHGIKPAALAHKMHELQVIAQLLVNSASLLHNLIKAAAQASGSCLPPAILQHAGLQALQALAAPLQQLQFFRGGCLLSYAKLHASENDGGGLGEACYALVTAACGPAPQDAAGEVCWIAR
jgi:hypothetical protein